MRYWSPIYSAILIASSVPRLRRPIRIRNTIRETTSEFPLARDIASSRSVKGYEPAHKLPPFAKPPRWPCMASIGRPNRTEGTCPPAHLPSLASSLTSGVNRTPHANRKDINCVPATCSEPVPRDCGDGIACRSSAISSRIPYRVRALPQSSAFIVC